MPEYTDEQVNAMHSVALREFRAGRKILPITADGRKVPLIRYTSGAGECQVPTSEADVWSYWQEEFRGAGVAIVTGGTSFEGSGILVIDVDVKNGAQGPQSLAEAQAELGDLPETLTYRSPSGGWEFVFAYPNDEVDHWRNWQSFRPGIDVRGHHGIVAAHGSADVRGSYDLEKDLPPAQLAIDWRSALIKPVGSTLTDRRFADRDDDAPLDLDYQQAEAADNAAQLVELASQPGGGKHGRLINAATAMGSWAHLLPSWDAAVESLVEAIRAAHATDGTSKDFVEGKVRKSVTTLMHNGSVNPKWAEERATFIGNAADYGIEVSVHEALVQVPARSFDDLGNADRLVDHHGQHVAWLADAESWITYDGSAWSMEGSATGIMRACVATINAAPEAEKLTHSDDVDPASEDKKSDRARFFGHMSRSRSARNLSAMASVARTHDALQQRVEDFDRDPMLLNVANGVVDLRTGELLAHDPALHLIARTAVAYDADALAPRFARFLDEVQPDVEVQAYLQRIIGYTLTGSTSEQVFFVHHGSGANGKSVFMDLVARLLGSYAQTVPRSTLMAKRGDGGIPADLARMVGKRLLRASETQAGARFDEGLIKDLVSGEQVSARYLRGQFFDFTPVGKIHLTTNFLPHLSNGGTGIERRLRDIGWNVTVAERDRDAFLVQHIAASELPGILTWAVRGALDWQDGGLRTPAAVAEKTAQHVRSGDPLHEWIEAALLTTPAAQVETTELYRDYVNWARSSGEKSMTQRSFSEALSERGYERGKHSVSRRSVVTGVTLAKGLPWTGDHRFGAGFGSYLDND